MELFFILLYLALYFRKCAHVVNMEKGFYLPNSRIIEVKSIFFFANHRGFNGI